MNKDYKLKENNLRRRPDCFKWAISCPYCPGEQFLARQTQFSSNWKDKRTKNFWCCPKCFSYFWTYKGIKKNEFRLTSPLKAVTKIYPIKFNVFEIELPLSPQHDINLSM